LTPIKRRTIRVGGGELHARHRGTVDVICEDGSSMVLADVLYVPRLGINLLSGRRMCQMGLEGAFDAENLYFKDRKKKVITSTMSDSLVTSPKATF